MGRGLDRIHERIDKNAENTTAYFRKVDEASAAHQTESAVRHAGHESRLKEIEGHMEKRSTLKTGTILASIGTLAGIVGTWLSKKMGIGAVMICVLFAGCGTPESVRQANYFNIEAGVDIQTVAAQLDTLADQIAPNDPSTAVALRSYAAHLRAVGKNIEEGARQIERKLGAPEQPKAYSVDEHAKTNAQAKADIDSQEAVKKGITGWIEGAVTKVADFVWPGLGGILMGAYFWLRKKTQYDNLKKGAGVIVDVVNKLPADLSKTVKGAVESGASKVGAGDLVKGMVKMLEK